MATRVSEPVLAKRSFRAAYGRSDHDTAHHRWPFFLSQQSLVFNGDSSIIGSSRQQPPHHDLCYCTIAAAPAPVGKRRRMELQRNYKLSGRIAYAKPHEAPLNVVRQPEQKSIALLLLTSLTRRTHHELMVAECCECVGRAVVVALRSACTPSA